MAEKTGSIGLAKPSRWAKYFAELSKAVVKSLIEAYVKKRKVELIMSR